MNSGPAAASAPLAGNLSGKAASSHAPGASAAGVSAPAGRLRVGGLVPMSSCDYPDKLAAVVFCQGCPWHCRYCHNPHLQPAQAGREVAWSEVARLLERRRGLLDAVVFTGGEPTAQPALPAAMEEVRGMGYLVALHTAGIYPRRLRSALPFADWVGFDVKASAAGYAPITGVPGSAAPAFESLRYLLASGLPHEIRTTVHAGLTNTEALIALASELARLGVRRYVLQEFRREGCADEALCDAPARAVLTDELCERIAALFASFEVRRA